MKRPVFTKPHLEVEPHVVAGVIKQHTGRCTDLIYIEYKQIRITIFNIRGVLSIQYINYNLKNCKRKILINDEVIENGK